MSIKRSVMDPNRIKLNRVYFTDNITATSKSLLTTGHRFLEAAGHIFDVSEGNIDPEYAKVIYYLTGHGIELVLKAFLCKKNYDLKTLSLKPFGHNLEKLVLESNSKGLLALSSDQFKAIQEFTPVYSKKEIGYEETEITLPGPWVYFSIGEFLYKEVTTQIK